MINWLGEDTECCEWRQLGKQVAPHTDMTFLHGQFERFVNLCVESISKNGSRRLRSRCTELDSRRRLTLSSQYLRVGRINAKFIGLNCALWYRQQEFET